MKTITSSIVRKVILRSQDNDIHMRNAYMIETAYDTNDRSEIEFSLALPEWTNDDKPLHEMNLEDILQASVPAKLIDTTKYHRYFYVAAYHNFGNILLFFWIEHPEK